MYKLGDLVISKKGRDCEKLFMVVGLVSEDYVHIANGTLRKLEKPKKKKVKHLRYFGKRVLEDNLTNSRLKEILRDAQDA